ncbi:MAG: hypothetical protein ACI9VT_001002 [Psychroserpens sp.]|jgi:hypothetical protein
MQARYYDPVIGRFYSNDPVDVMGHITRGNPIHGFNRYTYANNNPYKYVDPDGKFGLIGFAIGFAADAAGQYFTTGKVDVGQALVSGVAGAVTGGMASVYRTAGMISKTIVVGGTGVTSAVGASAIKDSMAGKTPTIASSAKAAAYSLAGPGKVVSKYVGAVAQSMVKSVTLKQTVSNATGGIASSVVDASLDKAAKPDKLKTKDE